MPISLEKRQKFVALANRRVNRAIRDLRLVGNLSNRSIYDFTEEDVKKILKVLQRELDSIRSRFGDRKAMMPPTDHAGR